MTGDFQLEMNEYLPLRDVVFQTLRQAILKGELKPGERLMEIQLAERLGVSRTPIREAIRKLELEGLVLMIPRKGAEVAKISENNLRDVLEVRRTLEELAVDLACQRMTEEELERIHAILEGDESRLPKNTGRHTSIGIQNVNRRIRLVYGDEYGLSIEQEEDCITVSTITIPYVDHEDEISLKERSEAQNELKNIARLNK